ncbi:dihydrofolate reductase family protein [Brevibacterium sp. GP-SGM9]|uniref:dihydrofolate reductase family protein n=1 Tax=Brevibacterium sp. GP-SGM9 TaxID=3376990 RepID=UPI0039A52BAC
MEDWENPLAEAIDRAHKFVMSGTLSRVDWNAELVDGPAAEAVERLKAEPGERLWVGGVTLPKALADLGPIDEYEFLVQPMIAGHGPSLPAGLSERLRLELVPHRALRSGTMVLRYRIAH